MRNNEFLKKMHELYRVDKVFTNILEKHVKRAKGLDIEECMKNLLDETKSQMWNVEKYLSTD